MTTVPSDSPSEKEFKRPPKLHFLQRQKQAERFNNNDILGILAFATMAINVLVLLVQLLLFRGYNRLAAKPAPSLVQLTSGESIQVIAVGSKDRTPDVILNFTKDTLSLLLTWTGTLPSPDAEEAATDPGVTISGTSSSKSTRITTSAYQAGFALSEDFRRELLLELGEIMPSGIFSNGAAQVVFVPLEISQPTQIEPGKWRLSLVANLMVFDQQSVLGEPIPFNKEIFVQAVEPPEFDADLVGFAQAIQQIRASGLEIYAIRDL